MVRFVRKHSTALIAAAVYNFVIFFPVAFMGRVLSPNDVFYNFAPWSAMRQDLPPQNPLLNDPPTSYYTVLSMVKSDWRTFHWDPYIAAGVPGFGSSAASSLTPVILIPVLLVPLVWSYTAIVFLKLNLAFLFSYLWLREERLGRHGAAIGAILIAGAGVYAVRWLWQITNATVFYPALLWIVVRTFRGYRTSIALIALIALSFGISGFPAAIAYGIWITVAYAVFYGLRRQSRRFPSRGAASAILRTAAGVLIAVMIAAPMLVPFIQFIRRSGYLDVRQKTSLEAVYPLSHWRSFIEPDRLGNPAYKNWMGDPSLGVMNNYVEATTYLGLLAIPLVLLGLFNRRARARWFWLAAMLVLLACMFGLEPIAPLFASLPGFKYSALARLSLLLPLPVGYLAAAGVRLLRKRVAVIAGAIAIVVAFDLALVAGRFHPYLEPKDAAVPSTPIIDFLHSQPGPFRIAPFFDYFWPNAAELFRLEDVRSHFSSERDYRRLLQRLEPGVWNGRSTVLQFNSLQYQFNDPLAGMLGIRYYLEHKAIDIIKWSTIAATTPGVKETGTITLEPGDILDRTVRIDTDPFWAIEVPAHVEQELTRNARLELSLLKNGAVLWTRAFTPTDVNALSKLYVPVRPHARVGDELTLRVRSHGVRGHVLAGEGGIYYGRVATPVVFDRELPDGRLFRNLAELPRFWTVTSLRKLNDDEFLAAKDVDYATEAVITDDPILPPALGASPARVTLRRYAPHEQRLVVDSAAPTFLASSEKLTPELAVTLDGRRIRPTEINMLFAGVHVPAGRHEIVFSRRIGRGWWWMAIVGGALWAVVVAGRMIGRGKTGW
ncbi:MAG TPA: hypothetical protein VNA69_04905 [Thermoanaerobaculia bacterium]|nr:hypothetical protein [Thermoanaerobaculia bacterium]